MNTAATRQIRRTRDERAEFAAACWRLAYEHRGDGDVQDIELSARAAERDAARIGALLKL